MLLKRLILAATIALTGSMLVAAPSQADAAVYSDQGCWHANGGLNPPDTVCMSVTYHKHTNGSTGMTLNTIRIWIVDSQLGEFNQDAISPCNNLRIWNDNDVVKWRRDSPPADTWAQSCELSGDTPSKTWTVNIPMPTSDSISEGWTFDANLFRKTDRNDVHIGCDQFN